MRISGGTAKGIRLKSPQGVVTRPTSELVREAIFNVISPLGLEGSRVLDLYAGTGAMGIEALSRGAAWADFVESDPRQCAAIKENLRLAGVADKGHVYCAKVEKALSFLNQSYNFIFLDPPYGIQGLDRVLEALASSQAVVQGAVMVLEHSSRESFAPASDRLAPKDRRIYGDTAVTFLEAREAK